MTTQPQHRPFTLHALKAGLCVLLMSALWAGTSTLPASAQSIHDPEEAAFRLAQRLTSPVAEERDEALQQVTEFAYYRPEIDLSPTVPVLVNIYKNNPVTQYRLAAVAALHAIGDEAGMKQVRQRFLDEPSLQVQYVSLCAVLDHFGPEAFAGNAKAAALAQNLITRNREFRRLLQRPSVSDPVVAKKQQ